MMIFEWNSLRKGDKVLAHDPRSGVMALLPGVVAMVDAHKGSRGVNSVGVDVASADPAGVILWPSRLAVHNDPRDKTESCWRCRAISSERDRNTVGTAGSGASSDH